VLSRGSSFSIQTFFLELKWSPFLTALLNPGILQSSRTYHYLIHSSRHFWAGKAAIAQEAEVSTVTFQLYDVIEST
jgi:hypothetical protein